MKEIRISPTAQIMALLGLLAAIAGIVALQVPELQRYLKIRSM
jgi:hypothetical protein